MSSFIWSLIEVNILIAILFVGYMAVRNHFSFKQQRAALIGLPFMAITAIYVKSIIDFSAVSYSIPIVELQPIFVGQTNAVATVNEPIFNLTYIYGLGVVIIGLLFVFRLARLLLFFQRNKSSKVGVYHIYKVSGKSSFSFFNRIQITPDLSAQEQEIVLEHEKMHVDKKHSIDTIVLELFHVVFWFNPVFLFIKRELINLHEFEVDAVMYQKHQVSYMKFLVNYALGLTTSNYLLTSKFYNKLTLKKRIKTMKTNYKKRSWMLGLLPVAAIGFILIQCTKEDLKADANTFEGSTMEQEEPVLNVMEGLEERGAIGVVDYFTKFWSGDDQNIPFLPFVLYNTTYPQQAIDNGEEGDVMVEFIVSAEGKIEKCWIKEGVSESLDNEALRVVSAAPYFEPTIVNGEAIRAQYTVPIVFSLDQAESMNQERTEDLSESFKGWNVGEVLNDAITNDLANRHNNQR